MKLFSIKLLISIVTSALLVTLVLTNKSIAQSGQIVTQLASQVGVSEQQAGGGIGALMKYAQQSLDQEQFAKVANALPELAGLLESAPAIDQDSTTVTQLSTLLGESDTADTAKKLANLHNSLDKLGLNSEQIRQFIPVVIDYAKSKGGDAIAGLLGQALSTL